MLKKNTIKSLPQEEFHTHQMVVKCLSGILNFTNGAVYDPCCGKGTLICGIAKELKIRKNFSFYGQTFLDNEQDLQPIHDNLKNIIEETYIEEGNALSDDRFENKKFDIILSNPPFNFSDRQINHWRYDDPRWIFGYPHPNNANFAWLQHTIYHLNNNGKAGVIMPTNSLFSNDIYQKQIRGNIIESGILEAIIVFPKYLFDNTDVSFCIWLINKGSVTNKSVLFIDASRIEPLVRKKLLPEHIDIIVGFINSYREGKLSGSNHCYSVNSIEDIIKNDYSLSPNLYLLSNYIINKENSFFRLNDIYSEICKLGFSREFLESLNFTDECLSQNWTKRFLLELYDSKVGISKRQTVSDKGYPIIDVNTVINNNFVPDKLIKRADVSKTEIEKYNIKSEDILINRTSEAIQSLGCGCVAVSDCNAVFDIFIKRLRPCTNEIDPMYISGFMKSDIYRKQIADFTPTYTTRTCLNDNTLRKVLIYFPEINIQKNIGKVLYAIFNEGRICMDEYKLNVLKEFERLFIHNYITYPILKNFE